MASRRHSQPPGHGPRRLGPRPGLPRSGTRVRGATLLIVGGELVDGSGAPRRMGSLAISEGRMRVLRPADGLPPAGRTIDAAGLGVLGAGVHRPPLAWRGLAILADPRHEPKVHQGVTSEIVGVDGNGYAPFASRADLEAFVDLNSGVMAVAWDISAVYDWDSAASYLGHPLRPWTGGEHRDHGRQQRAAHLARSAGMSRRVRGTARGHARRAPRGHAGGAPSGSHPGS